MDEAARHAPFIWAAYAAFAVVVVGLVARAILDHRAQRRALARLEEAATASN